MKDSPSSRLRGGLWAWGGIVAYVVIYDVFALRTRRSTLSAAFHHVSTVRRVNVGLVLFWFYLTGHLFRWVPRRFDMFRRVFGA